jgi:hypothetical protein
MSGFFQFQYSIVGVSKSVNLYLNQKICSLPNLQGKFFLT